MAEWKKGIDQLRMASCVNSVNVCAICEAAEYMECDKDRCCEVRGLALSQIADQIERDHSDELARKDLWFKDQRDRLIAEAEHNRKREERFRRERDEAFHEAARLEKELEAKRDLADEAREVVARLRGIGEGRSSMDRLIEVFGALGIDGASITVSIGALPGRLIELIGHGGKQDVDVAALRQLADKIDACASYLGHGGRADLTCNMSDAAEDVFGIDEETNTADARVMLETVAERIRKAVEGAPGSDAESDAERSCAALLEWRDQVAGLLGIDAGSMADEVQDAIMAELDERLMPPGMTWPSWEDDKPVCRDDAPDGVTVVSLYLDGSGYGLVDAILDHQAGECVKRPEPEVRGSDGLPIVEGDTVYHCLSGSKYTVKRIAGKALLFEEFQSGLCDPSAYTHTQPETQQRIDDDASMPPRRYYADKIGHDVGLKDDEEVFEAVALHLLRRQRELDAKTMGGDAS